MAGLRSEHRRFKRGTASMAGLRSEGSWTSHNGSSVNFLGDGTIFWGGRHGVQWLLRNQLADGSWFAPARAVPVQPHTFESFPNGWHQFVSDAASCWATMALLFTMPDKPHSGN